MRSTRGATPDPRWQGRLILLCAAGDIISDPGGEEKGCEVVQDRIEDEHSRCVSRATLLGREEAGAGGCW